MKAGENVKRNLMLSALNKQTDERLLDKLQRSDSDLEKEVVKEILIKRGVSIVGISDDQAKEVSSIIDQIYDLKDKKLNQRLGSIFKNHIDDYKDLSEEEYEEIKKLHQEVFSKTVSCDLSVKIEKIQKQIDKCISAETEEEMILCDKIGELLEKYLGFDESDLTKLSVEAVDELISVIDEIYAKDDNVSDIKQPKEKAAKTPTEHKVKEVKENKENVVKIKEPKVIQLGDKRKTEDIISELIAVGQEVEFIPSASLKEFKDKSIKGKVEKIYFCGKTQKEYVKLTSGGKTFYKRLSYFNK